MQIMKGFKKLFFGLFISTIVIFSCQVQAKADPSITVSAWKTSSPSINIDTDTPTAPSTVSDTLELQFRLVETGEFQTVYKYEAESDGGSGFKWKSSGSAVTTPRDYEIDNVVGTTKYTTTMTGSKLRALYQEIGSPVSSRMQFKLKYTIDSNVSESPVYSSTDTITGCKPAVILDDKSSPKLTSEIEVKITNPNAWFYEGENYTVTIQEGTKAGYLSNVHWKPAFTKNPNSAMVPTKDQTTYSLTFTTGGSSSVQSESANKFTYTYDTVSGVVMKVGGTVVSSPVSLEVNKSTTAKISAIDSAFEGNTTWTVDDLASTWQSASSLQEFELTKKDKAEITAVAYKSGKQYSITNSIPNGTAPGQSKDLTLTFTTAAEPSPTVTPSPGSGMTLKVDPINLTVGYYEALDSSIVNYAGAGAKDGNTITLYTDGSVAKEKTATGTYNSVSQKAKWPAIEGNKPGFETYVVTLTDSNKVDHDATGTVNVYPEPEASYSADLHSITLKMPSAFYGVDDNEKSVEASAITGYNVYIGLNGSYVQIGSGKVNAAGTNVKTVTIPASMIETVVNTVTFQNVLTSAATSVSLDLMVCPVDAALGEIDLDICDESVTLYKITFGNSSSSTSSNNSSTSSSNNFTYRVNLGGQDVERQYFYGLKGQTFQVTAVPGDNTSFGKWSTGSTSNPMAYTVTAAATISATGKNSTTASSTSSSSSSKSSSSSAAGNAGSGSGSGSAGASNGDYDDVPKTGESKADIWILWGVLLISILGAGFMIYKRFGLVRAIAQVDAAEAAAREAQEQERIDAEAREKEERLKVLKDLRNL